MPSRDEFSRQSEIEAALREHYAQEVGSTEFAPMTAAEIRAVAGANEKQRRLGSWLALAAAVVVFVGGALIYRGVSAGLPTPAVPMETPSASPAPTNGTTSGPTGVAVWTRRASAPIVTNRYAQASVGGSVYLFAGTTDDATCTLDGYRYDTAAGTWQRLSDGPARADNSCVVSYAFATGPDVYLLVIPDSSPGTIELYVYHTASDTWATLPSLAMDGPGSCSALGLESGIFCYADQGSATDVQSPPMRYSVFDYASATWRQGEVQLANGAARGEMAAQVVRFEGRQVLLLHTLLWSHEAVVALFDPADGVVSHETRHALAEVPVGEIEWADPGVVYFGPPSDAGLGGDGDYDPKATTGLFVDVATSAWWTVEIPSLDGGLAQQKPSDADWALWYFPSETTGWMEVHNYLYNPVADSWQAVNPLPFPVGESDGGEYPFANVGASMRCRWSEPYDCWGLQPGSFGQVTTPVTQAEITASNNTVR